MHPGSRRTRNYPTNGTSQSHMTRDIGPSVRICQLNIEGISKSKCELLSRLLEENDVDVVVLQETHTANETNLISRGKINGFTLIGAHYHHAYGIATYVKSTIENAILIEVRDMANTYIVTIEIAGTKIANIYKPPNISWSNETLPSYSHPAMYVGDFNSHHTLWKYQTSDNNGLQLVDWAESNHLHLVFDAKDKGTFNSARWQRDYNPDLCFVTSNNEQRPQQVSRRVLADFPHSQHRPVLFDLGTKIPLVNSVPRPRWNFNKAGWNNFAKDLDANVRWILPTAKNYARFVGTVISAAKKHIPRGYRREYIPGWSTESDKLYQEFLCSGESEIADSLLQSLDKNRLNRWARTMEDMDFTHSSRKAWGLIRKLGGCNSISSNKSKIDPELIANRIVETSKVKSDKEQARAVKRALSELKATTSETAMYSRKFTLAEVEVAVSKTKSGKAAGFDGIYPEFLKNCGTNTKLWLAKFFSNIMETGLIPKEFKRTKIIAILKPGKLSDRADSYRPIALLSVCYKILERLIYNRIEQVINAVVPNEQAGFRTGRSCTDQVLSLTTYIEAGFQKKLKTSAVLVDLTAAYDTVWRTGMIYKFLKVVKCKKLAHLINNMLSNRSFQVFINDDVSKQRKLNNGLPQGSVLAPLLFNLYMYDLPTTQSRKFQYADDLALAIQHQNMAATEPILTEDLATLNKFFKEWRLIPSMSKTESACFHLNNKLANEPLQVKFNDVMLQHNTHPKYLGITLDRTLSYKQHLKNTSEKLKTRNNLLYKLASTSWGASANALRTAALGLVYSAAEYGAPVWLNSAHTHLVDTQLNSTMRLISGTIGSTPVQWLPVLSNIAPPSLRRDRALLREYDKICDNPSLPIHQDIDGDSPHHARLKSRKPSLSYASHLSQSNFDISEEWKNSWKTFTPKNHLLIDDPSIRVPGFHLPRYLWSRLNRVRSNHGRCADSLFKWGALPSSACDCGAPRQTINHIVADCRLRSFHGTLFDVHQLTPEALQWLSGLDILL